MPPRLSVVQWALLYHTFQTSEQLSDSASAQSTKHKTTGTKNRSIETSHKQKALVRVCTWAGVRERSFEGANRRKECVPCTLLSHRVQQTRLDVHHTLARVQTGRQNTAGDNENDTLGKGHRADVRRPMLHGTGSVKAGNACPRTKTGDFKNGKSTTRIQNRGPLKVANKATGHTSQPESPV